ncbi:MAG: hypothetical protein P4L40_16920 [Terracidiphilus sp.]|nr:hypothetical protein [Terracidiphilus sp.]
MFLCVTPPLLQLVTTLLAGSFGGITAFFIRRYQEEPYELGVIANAILSGLVAITGPCATVDAWAAGVIGGEFLTGIIA